MQHAGIVMTVHVSDCSGRSFRAHIVFVQDPLQDRQAGPTDEPSVHKLFELEELAHAQHARRFRALRAARHGSGACAAEQTRANGLISMQPTAQPGGSECTSSGIHDAHEFDCMLCRGAADPVIIFVQKASITFDATSIIRKLLLFMRRIHRRFVCPGRACV